MKIDKTLTDLENLVNLINQDQTGIGTYIDAKQLKIKEIKSLDDTLPSGNTPSDWDNDLSTTYNTEITLVPIDSNSPYKEKKIKYNRLRLEKLVSGEKAIYTYKNNPVLENFTKYNKVTKTLDIPDLSKDALSKGSVVNTEVSLADRTVTIKVNDSCLLGQYTAYMESPYYGNSEGYALGTCMHLSKDPFASGKKAEIYNSCLFHYGSISEYFGLNNLWYQGNQSWYYDQVKGDPVPAGLPGKSQRDNDRYYYQEIAGFMQRSFQLKGVHHRTTLIEFPNDTKKMPAAVLSKGSLYHYLNNYNRINNKVYTNNNTLSSVELKRHLQYCGNVLVFPENLEYIEDGALLETNPIVLVLNEKFQGFFGYKTKNHILATLRKIYYPKTQSPILVHAKFFTSTGGIFTPGQATKEFENRGITLIKY
jgi:hypothetical protein